MKFEKEHTLPLLAIQATWAAVQQRSEKILALEKLIGGLSEDSNKVSGPMSKTDMLTEAGKLASFQAKWNAKKKKEREAKLESA